MSKTRIITKTEDIMRTKLIKRIGMLALCGVLFCGGMQMTAKAASNDYIAYTMSWSGNKCTVKTGPCVVTRGYYMNAYVFLYNSSGSILGSKACNNMSPRINAIAALSKSSVKKALGVHYCTSKAGGAGTVYGYTKLERNKKSTY